jgi:hypothetical protein
MYLAPACASLGKMDIRLGGRDIDDFDRRPDACLTLAIGQMLFPPFTVTVVSDWCLKGKINMKVKFIRLSAGLPMTGGPGLTLKQKTL